MAHRYVYIFEEFVTIDTPEETAAARLEMRDLGIASLPIYAGGPDPIESDPFRCVEETATGDTLLAAADPEECEDNACAGCAWCNREVGS